jgi:hypothetical protein
MGFLDKIKENIQDTATLAKEGIEKARDSVEDVQTKRLLNQAYTDLGRRTAELAEAGTLSAQQLTAELDKVRHLKAQLEAEEQAARTSGEPAPPA